MICILDFLREHPQWHPSVGNTDCFGARMAAPKT